MPILTRRYLVVALIVCGSVGVLVARQAADLDLRLEPQRARELTSRLFGDDTSWRWVPAMDNRVPLVKSEKRLLVGSWQGSDGGREVVLLASIYVVATEKDARRWLAFHATGADGWTIRPYVVGNGGWRGEHPTGQVEISLRRGRFVVTVSAKDAALVERCAAQIVLYLDAG
jgi:hypothetical protein